MAASSRIMFTQPVGVSNKVQNTTGTLDKTKINGEVLTNGRKRKAPNMSLCAGSVPSVHKRAVQKDGLQGQKDTENLVQRKKSRTNIKVNEVMDMININKLGKTKKEIDNR